MVKLHYFNVATAQQVYTYRIYDQNLYVTEINRQEMIHEGIAFGIAEFNVISDIPRTSFSISYHGDVTSSTKRHLCVIGNSTYLVKPLSCLIVHTSGCWNPSKYLHVLLFSCFRLSLTSLFWPDEQVLWINEMTGETVRKYSWFSESRRRWGPNCEWAENQKQTIHKQMICISKLLFAFFRSECAPVQWHRPDSHKFKLKE